MNNYKFHVKYFFFLVILFPAYCLSQHSSTTTFDVRPFPRLPQKEKNIWATLQTNQNFINLEEEKKEWFYLTNLLRLKPKFFYDSIVSPIINTYPSIQSEHCKSLKNDLYRTPQLTSLIPNPKLLKVSQNHSDDLMKHLKSPAHNSTNGQTFQQRMISNEINKCAAENISYGPSNTIMALVLLLIDEGIPDFGHRKNLLAPEYAEMGIGISNYPGNIVLVVQDFACTQTF